MPLGGCGLVDAFALGKHKAVFGLRVPLDAVFDFRSRQAGFKLLDVRRGRPLVDFGAGKVAFALDLRCHAVG